MKNYQLKLRVQCCNAKQCIDILQVGNIEGHIEIMADDPDTEYGDHYATLTQDIEVTDSDLDLKPYMVSLMDQLNRAGICTYSLALVDSIGFPLLRATRKLVQDWPYPGLSFY